MEAGQSLPLAGRRKRFLVGLYTYFYITSNAFKGKVFLILLEKKRWCFLLDLLYWLQQYTKKNLPYL